VAPQGGVRPLADGRIGMSRHPHRTSSPTISAWGGRWRLRAGRDGSRGRPSREPPPGTQPEFQVVPPRRSPHAPDKRMERRVDPSRQRPQGLVNRTQLGHVDGVVDSALSTQ